MIRDFSAGGIVFNRQNQVLLVRNYKPDREVDYWGFPKGHYEEGEKGPQTALREVEEETGVKARVITKVGNLKYFFAWQGEKTFKTVAFFLMEYLSGEPKPQTEEVTEVGWYGSDETLAKITYPDERELFTKALGLRGQVKVGV